MPNWMILSLVTVFAASMYFIKPRLKEKWQMTVSNYVLAALLVFLVVFVCQLLAQDSLAKAGMPVADLGFWGELFAFLKLRGIGFLGLGFIVGVSYLLCDNRRAVQWQTVASGILLQFVFAVVILKTGFGQAVFIKANDFFNLVLDFSEKGVSFVFGSLGDPTAMGTVFGAGRGFVFAFSIAGTIIFMSALMTVMYYLGIMQKVVYGFAVIMQKLMKTSGSESLASAANIFLGQTEAPLVIRPYLEKMTHSEVMALMVGGMANVAGGVLAAYVGMGIEAGHLLAGSVMSAPATLVIAKLIIPEVQKSETAGTCKLINEKIDSNVLDAACRGAGEGVTLALNVMGMLIAFIALVAMLNYGFVWATGLINDGVFWATGKYFSHAVTIFPHPVTIETVLGYLFMPFAYLMGIPSQDVLQAGSLLGIKTVLNEFVAYNNMAQIKATLNPRTVVIMTYALCGFANFSSIAIQVGGIGALMPSRRKDLASLGLKAMIAGTFCTLMTATIAGILL